MERATELGIVATYRNGGESDHCTILESLGGGVGWFDFDRDGWLDLVATGGGGITADETISGRPCMLFRSEGGKTFHPAAAEAGIASDSLYSHGIAVGDHDNDGFQDLLVTGYGVPQFWHNMGDGTFVAAPSPAGEDARWSSSAGWADLNGDGVLDLYLARYVNWSFDNHPRCGQSATVRDICPPRSFEGLPDAVFLGNGDGTFTDASAAAGLRSDGKGLGVLLADLDVDGDVDIYVANDTTDNFLYVNDGHGHLAENGLVSGTALDDQGVPNGSMGIDLCDFNRDGLPDVWVTNFEREWFAPVAVEVPLDAADIEAFATRATAFTRRLPGTLAASVTVPESLSPRDAHRVNLLCEHLEYGVVAVNTWSALAFALGSVPWGGFPGGTLATPGSGIGWVHDPMFLPLVHNTILQAPLLVRPTPPWFPWHPRGRLLARGVVDVYAALARGGSGLWPLTKMLPAVLAG